MQEKDRAPAGRCRSAERRGPVAPRAHPLLGLQRVAGNGAAAALVQRLRDGAGEVADAPATAVAAVLRGAGRPLPAPLRADMEARLGADFSTVRLHTGSSAQASVQRLGARAWTSGENVVVGSGAADRRTLAHELEHVKQQRRGPVAGTDHGDGVAVSDPGDRFERAAVAAADHALRSDPAPSAASGWTSSAAGPGVVQRAVDPTSGVAGAATTRPPRDRGWPVPEETNLRAGSVLTHGTGADLGGGPGRTGAFQVPRAPAWFSTGSWLAAHAGTRARRDGATSTRTRLFNYQLRSNLELLRWRNAGAVRRYLETSLNRDMSALSEKEVAAEVARMNPGRDGYRVDQDAIRGEIETVLFDQGLGKVAPLVDSALEHEDVAGYGTTSGSGAGRAPRDYDDLYLIRPDLGRRRMRGAGQTLHTYNSPHPAMRTPDPASLWPGDRAKQRSVPPEQVLRTPEGDYYPPGRGRFTTHGERLWTPDQDDRSPVPHRRHSF